MAGLLLLGRAERAHCAAGAAADDGHAAGRRRRRRRRRRRPANCCNNNNHNRRQPQQPQQQQQAPWLLPPTSEHRLRSGEAKGLHMLMGLDERLRKEKAAADRAEEIAAEFDDGFVTQVYNYLSLGYPATARAYDDELAKISHIDAADLARDDAAIMDGLARAKGHIALAMRDGDHSHHYHQNAQSNARDDVDMDHDDDDDDDRCPRWQALKLYILEWARQHPDLGSFSPLAWGVQERRGSWGI